MDILALLKVHMYMNLNLLQGLTTPQDAQRGCVFIGVCFVPLSVLFHGALGSSCVQSGVCSTTCMKISQ